MCKCYLTYATEKNIWLFFKENVGHKKVTATAERGQPHFPFPPPVQLQAASGRVRSNSFAIISFNLELLIKST
jgi:hypothetical protein